MAQLNLHAKPFDEGTLTKLEFFEDYTQAWIPTFLFGKPRTICIFDFFAGPGHDSLGVPGSPIRILGKIREQFELIRNSQVSVRLFLNEFDSSKFASLNESCSKYFLEFPELYKVVSVEYSNDDFGVCFERLLSTIEGYQSLVFLDQNGVKFLDSLAPLTRTRGTDFMFFAASSYIWRFGEVNEFKTHLDIDITELRKNPYKFIHRTLLDELRKKLPLSSGYELFPFSLKKSANIYGLIFGAAHPRAVDKFLTLAWQKNPINGEANFDIHDDRAKLQGSLFESAQLTKIEAFQESVTEMVLSGEIQDNFQMLDFVRRNGHIGKHAHDVLIELRKQGKIDVEGRSPLINYQNVHRGRRLIKFRVINS
ncbi:MAG: three-Cys-motif partner protein TcmP [Acidobacteria bacterium]|nr:three-Cys-motif partner protein TcmP [Acidobacteriota bacterium]